MFLKSIFLNILVFVAGIFYSASMSYAQDVSLPDINVSAESEEEAKKPEPVPSPEAQAPATQTQNIESIVKEVFSEPSSPALTAVSSPLQESKIAEPLPQPPVLAPTSEEAKPGGPVITPPETAMIEKVLQKPSRNYAAVEIKNKPEYSQEVAIEAPKPMEETENNTAEIKIEVESSTEPSAMVESHPESRTESEPMFSELPRSMRLTNSASLVSRTENFETIAANSDEENDILIQASKNKPVDVDQIPVVPIDETKPVDDLEVLSQLTELPQRQREFIVKSDVNIERGEFKDPFYEELEEPNSADEGQTNLSSIESPANNTAPSTEVAKNDLDALKETGSDTENSSAIPKSLTKSEFYVQDKGLSVQVKSPNVNIAKDKKNAYDALNLGMYESAISYYKKALAENQNDKTSLFGLATAYHKSKQYENAKNTYLELINRDRNFFPAVNNYIILVTEENPDDAIPKLNDLWNKNPSFAAIPAQIANLYYKKNSLDKAAGFYLQALKLDPENIEYKYNLAVILEKMGQNKIAAKYYKNLLDEAAKGKELPENPLTIRDRFFFLISDKS